MFPSLNAAAIVALTFSSLVASTPVPVDVSVLQPVTKESFDSETLAALNGLDKRATSTGSNTNAADPITLLTPVSREDFNAVTLGALNSLSKRAASSAIAPATNVTLYYAAPHTVTGSIVAEMNATMKFPTVLLEEIPTIKSVECTKSSVAVTFTDSATFASSLDLWSAKTFLLFTNHLGNCDNATARGIYKVDGVSSNKAKLTITAKSTETEFKDCTDNMDLSFLTVKAPKAKRDILTTFASVFPNNLVVANESLTVAGAVGPVKGSISVAANDTSASGSIGLAGHLSFNFWKFKFTKMSLDLEMTLAAGTTLSVKADGAITSNVYTYHPTDLTIAPFSIAHILAVGPMISFELGAEVAAKADVGIETTLSANLDNGVVHLDLLQMNSSTATGWTPTFTQHTNITGAIEAQANPYIKVTAEVGLNLLNGMADYSAGITVKPEIVNAFSADATIDSVNFNNITFPAATEKTCPNGLWFASTFHMDVTAYVTGLYSKKIYDLTKPIYKPGCWSWM